MRTNISKFEQIARGSGLLQCQTSRQGFAPSSDVVLSQYGSMAQSGVHTMVESDA